MGEHSKLRGLEVTTTTINVYTLHSNYVRASRNLRCVCLCLVHTHTHHAYAHAHAYTHAHAHVHAHAHTHTHTTMVVMSNERSLSEITHSKYTIL